MFSLLIQAIKKEVLIKKIIIISIMGLFFVLSISNSACKKSETIEPEPVNNEPAITYEYDNLTTGDKTTFEINDMIYAKGTGKIADSRPYDSFVEMGVGLYDGTKRIHTITGLGTGKQLDIAVKGSSKLEKGILEEKQYAVKLFYSIIDSNGDLSDHQLELGTVEVKFEKSYEFDQLYGEGHVYNSIKNHTDEFAKILTDRGDVAGGSGNIYLYENVMNAFNNILLDGIDSNGNGELKNMWMDDRHDNRAGVLYIRHMDGTAFASFIGDEKTTYLIREFFKKYQ